MKRKCYPQNPSYELERIDGLKSQRSETSVVPDLIQFDSAEDRASVVVVGWIEFGSASAEDHLSFATVDLIELECAEILSVVAEWFEEDRREDLVLYLLATCSSLSSSRPLHSV